MTKLLVGDRRIDDWIVCGSLL